MVKMDDFKLTIFCLIVLVCIQTAHAQYQVTFALPENKVEGFNVGNVALDSNQTINLTETEKDNLRYSFLKETGFTQFFTIDDVTGDLNTSSVVIDRENICGFSVNCSMNFDVAARSGIFFAIKTVHISILDENDNAPIFSNNPLILNISEGEAIGTIFRIKGASDADMWKNNSIQGHFLEQSESYFELIEPKSFNRNYDLTLRLIKAHDRETTQKHSLKIIARDGGSPIRYGSLNITVNVLDDNDNAPMFAKAVYDVKIDENIQLNTVFLTLTATDKDSGSNGDISYKISERQSSVDAIKEIFEVNESSGQLSVIKRLVSEPAEFYEFTVEAVDHGNQPQSGEAMVKITVNDVENNPPTIDLNLLSPGNIGFVEIKENSPIGYFVAHVNAYDSDKGPNGDFTCRMNSNYFKLEKFAGGGFKVVVNGAIDREEYNSHNVTILCEDSGVPKLISAESFMVMIGDVNDNTPKFNTDVYSVNLQENTEAGEILMRVLASDADIGDNGDIEYTLDPQSQGRFVIDKNNGTIFTNESFDREKEPLIVVRVFATDKGDPRKSASVTITVTITDKNDVTPVIIPARPEFRVMENMGSNILVGHLNATDKDLGRNGQFRFAMAPISKAFPFAISESGEIRTTESLDREQQSRYDIPVTVTDFGVTSLSNTQYITIYVGDMNDNSPKVTFPNELNDTVKFMYPVKGYNVVTTVAAYDVDEGENSSLVFSIVAGNEMDIFEIDSRLGEVAIKTFIDIQGDMRVSLLVRVQDKGIIPQSTEINLVVDLMYANGTEASQTGDESGNKNIIIVIVVVITTVAIAIAIIIIILFLRSMDPRKRHASEDESGRYSDSGISCRSDSQSIPADVEMTEDQKAKKRKEVSFTLEYSMDGLDGGRNTESSTDDMYKQVAYPSSTSAPTPVPSYPKPQQNEPQPPQFSLQKQEKIDSHMKALKLQQYLWEAKSRDWEHPDLQQLPLDSESETSRETVTCDSGRGGSEDDMSTTSPTIDEKKRFSFTKDNCKRVSFLPPHSHRQQFVPHLPPPLKESTPVQHEPYSYGPPSYRSLKHDNIPVPHTKMGTKAIQHHVNNNQNRYNPTYSLQNTNPWRSLPQRMDMDPLRMRHDSFSSVRSNEDDGGSTTTSGSYTIDHDEVDAEIMPNYRHLVV